MPATVLLVPGYLKFQQLQLHAEEQPAPASASADQTLMSA